MGMQGKGLRGWRVGVELKGGVVCGVLIQIIEEGPITVASPSTVRQLEEGACRLARSVGYVGAATVEYLYCMESKQFYFLELNPRLQVRGASCRAQDGVMGVGSGVGLGF